MEQTFNMIKTRDKVSMVKADGTPIKKIFIGANWNKSRFAGDADYDMDIQGFVHGSDHKIFGLRDIVNYKTFQDGSNYPWCQFSGDNRTGDDDTGSTFYGKHYDEFFIVDADKFPADRNEFTIAISIYRAVQRMQNFGMVSNASITIFDYDNPDTVWNYPLTDNENFENLNAVEIGRLFRGSNGFRFEAIGSGYLGGMTELFKNFGMNIDEGRDGED